MSEGWGIVVGALIGVLGLVAVTVAPTYIVTTNSTARMEACVSNGGAYVHVPNTSKMECER